MDTLRLALLEQMLVSVSSLLLQSVLMLQELLNAFGQFGCGLEHTPSVPRPLGKGLAARLVGTLCVLVVARLVDVGLELVLKMCCRGKGMVHV